MIVDRQHIYLSVSAPVPSIRPTIPGSKDWDVLIKEGGQVDEEGTRRVVASELLHNLGQTSLCLGSNIPT